MPISVKSASLLTIGTICPSHRANPCGVNENAKVLNMSFSFAGASPELSNAIRHANRNHVICVASAGNDGRNVAVYPAAYSDRVMGVASTTDSDKLEYILRFP